MGCQGFFEILMITLISRKIRGGYRLMKHTVLDMCFKYMFLNFCENASTSSNNFFKNGY